MARKPALATLLTPSADLANAGAVVRLVGVDGPWVVDEAWSRTSGMVRARYQRFVSTTVATRRAKDLVTSCITHGDTPLSGWLAVSPKALRSPRRSPFDIATRRWVAAAAYRAAGLRVRAALDVPPSLRRASVHDPTQGNIHRHVCAQAHARSQWVLCGLPPTASLLSAAVTLVEDVLAPYTPTGSLHPCAAVLALPLPALPIVQQWCGVMLPIGRPQPSTTTEAPPVDAVAAVTHALCADVDTLLTPSDARALLAAASSVAA